MKPLFFTLLFVVCLSFAGGQDPETAEQIKQAVDAAKKTGVKVPDMQKLLEENAKEDEADKAADTPKPESAATAAATAPAHRTAADTRARTTGTAPPRPGRRNGGTPGN